MNAKEAENILKISQNEDITPFMLKNAQPGEPERVSELRQALWAFEQIMPDKKELASDYVATHLEDRFFQDEATILLNRPDKLLVGLRIGQEFLVNYNEIEWNDYTLNIAKRLMNGNTTPHFGLRWDKNSGTFDSWTSWDIRLGTIDSIEESISDKIYTRAFTGMITLPFPEPPETAPDAYILSIDDISNKTMSAPYS